MEKNVDNLMEWKHKMMEILCSNDGESELKFQTDENIVL